MKLKKRFLGLALFVGMSLFLASTAVFAYEAFLGPTGVLKWAKGKTYDGYTLIAPSGAKNIYLIDMEGRIVHQWKTQNENATTHADLLPNGNLLRGVVVEEERAAYFGGSAGMVQELSWDGKVVWEYVMNSPKGMFHHDFERMPNGNTLILAWEQKSWDEAIAKGRRPETVYKKEGVVQPGHPEKKIIHGIWPDFLVEVTPDKKIVWEWHVWDNIGPGPDQFNINYQLPLHVGPLYHGPDWTHFNTVQYLPQTDQVLLNSRNFGEFYIIDKKTKKMVYRWGNPSTHYKGRPPGGYTDDGDQILFGPHHAQLQPNGNITVLDNGTYRPSGNYTRVIEMDPKTGKIVWEFASNGAPRNGNSFFSAFQCGAQKLPNGNFLVTSTNSGHIFEVTQKKEIVWDMVNPIGVKGPVCTVEDNPSAIQVHRSYRYDKDFPGLKGKDLTPKGPLAPNCPDFRTILEQATANNPK